MRSLTKLTIAIASLAFTCASTCPVAAQNQDRPAAAQSQDNAMGKFVIQMIPIKVVPRIRKFELWIMAEEPRLEPPCCGKLGCRVCRPCPLPEIRRFVSGIEELGILVVSRLGSVIVPEEITIEIYSSDKEALFSIDLKCDECDRKVSLNSKGRPVAYVITPDKDAATALKKHFDKGNWINLIFKVKEAKDASDKVYLVNRTSLGR